MKSSIARQAAQRVLQACTMVVLLNAPVIQADEFGDDPPICMKKPYLPQCNPEPVDPPPPAPWPCDFSPFGCKWF